MVHTVAPSSFKIGIEEKCCSSFGSLAKHQLLAKPLCGIENSTNDIKVLHTAANGWTMANAFSDCPTF